MTTESRGSHATPPAGYPGAIGTASSTLRRRPAAPAALLGAGAALLLLPGLGSLDLWAPDEPRYAQVAEELRAGEAGWRGALLLHLGGDVYDQKPPLYFWLAALAGWPEGRVGERAARLPSALAGLGCVALTARLGARLLGPASGTLGAALLLTTGEFARLARRAQLDVLLTFFVLATFAAFVRIEERPGLPRPRDLVFLHGALGLAALVKGPVGLLIPVLAMVGFALWEGRAARLARLARPALLALSLGPALAWLAACAWLAPAGYLAGAVGENLFGRFFLGSSHARPAWYYLEQLPAGFLPWTLLWPVAACFGARRALAPGAEPGRARAWRLLVAWAGTGLLFFSASAGKRGLYLLPLYPAGALLCADAAIGLLAGRRREPAWARAVFAVLLLAVLGAAAALPALARRFGLEAPPALAPGLAALGLAAGAARRIVGSRQIQRLAVTVVFAGAVELSIFVFGLPLLEPEKSPRPLAAAAAALAAPGEPIGVTRRSLVGALLYYGDRPVRALPDADAVHRFLSSGGRVVVVPADRLELVTRRGPVRVHARLRSGRRSLLVVTPEPF